MKPVWVFTTLEEVHLYCTRLHRMSIQLPEGLLVRKSVFIEYFDAHLNNDIKLEPDFVTPLIIYTIGGEVQLQILTP